MGLFDSTCAVTGLSLAPLTRVACVPLTEEAGRFRPRGPVVFGPSNRGGGVDAPGAPEPPHALIAGPVYDALAAGGADLESSLARLGLSLQASSADGRQHTDGDVLRLFVQATHRFAKVEPLAAAISTYAALAEASTAARLSGEAPPAGWLAESATSWYGVAIAAERRASTSFEGLWADVDFLASFAFDPESLELTRTLLVVASVRGVLSELDLAPFIVLENAGRRARLDDRAGAEAVFGEYAEEDPRFTLDRDALAAKLPRLEAPLARNGTLVFAGSGQFQKPSWVSDDSGVDPSLGAARRYWTTAYGLTLFARIAANGWEPPAPRG